ncbi:FAD-dependent monooxygenase [Sulfobacillus harzensis]|uniref:Monooxygenase n=1 Tax=Sulfobacillus harzensis TaxID=2729629 RepID=A0A7Y0L6I2_9FIRM|nr:FAD-dependent monooxygenase [Sulfobacillus harzensis]NMP24130.1 monooxygenase [Sulfobacillus harzensis]
MSRNPDVPVLVVGAGPVGLTTALALHHSGVPTAILEQERENRLRPGSRAIYLHRETLKLLERISPGLGRSMAQHGVVWPIKRTWYKGRQVYARQYPAPDDRTLPPFASLPQVAIERFLWDALQKTNIEVYWEKPVTAVTVHSEGAVVNTHDGSQWHAAYVIGADGAHSSVRRQAGITMLGSRSANTFIVVDVKEDDQDPLPLERVFHYAHPAMDGRNVLFVPFLGGWRIDLQLFEGDDVNQFAGPEGVCRWLPRVMPQKYAERVTWVSTYQFLQVVAASLIDPQARILLVGEAAHLFAPFGARGLNSGVADALLAAEAVSHALRSKSEPERAAAIRAFAQERQRAAEYNRDAAGIALEHIQGASPGMQAKREVGALLAPVWPEFGRWLDEGPYGPRSGPPGVSTKY